MKNLLARVPYRYQGGLTLLGGFLIHMSLGSYYTFGNLTPYMTSYLRAYSNEHLTYSKTIFVLTVQSLATSISAILSGVLIARFKLKLKTVVVIGLVIMNLGQALTFFSIKASLPLVILTYGFMNGLGSGIAYLPPLSLAMKYFQKSKGFSNSTILFGYGAGGIIFTQLQTLFINPHNYSPDVVFSKDERYYSKLHEDLLRQVPKCFLLFTSIYVVLQLVGFFCMFETDEQQTAQESNEATINETADDKSTASAVDEIVEEPINTSDIEKLTVPGAEVNSLGVEYNDPNKGLTLKQIYKSSAYIKLWVLYMLLVMAPGLITAFFKTFGETFIEDDRFLSIVGSVCSFFNSFGRVFWGLIVDRISFKTCALMLNTLLIAFISTYYLISYTGSSTLYLIWTCIIFLGNSGVYVIMPTITAKAFGQKHFTQVYGSMFIVGIPAALISLGLTQFLDSLGFFWVSIMHVFFAILAVGVIFSFNVKTSAGRDI